MGHLDHERETDRQTNRGDHGGVSYTAVKCSVPVAVHRSGRVAVEETRGDLRCQDHVVFSHIDVRCPAPVVVPRNSGYRETVTEP